MRRTLVVLGLFVASVTLWPAQTLAVNVLFNFDSLADETNSSNNGDAIDTYMTNLYGSPVTVDLGATVERSRIESGHPINGLPYLGNSDGATKYNDTTHNNNRNSDGNPNTRDMFLHNRWNDTSIPSSNRDRIAMNFATPFNAFEVDWEIFPVTTGDADFKIKLTFTDNKVQEIIVRDQLPDGLSGCGSGTNDPSCAPHPNKFDGDIGHYVSPLFTDKGIKRMEFIDWNTAPIGIDNLRVEVPPPPQQQVPEPASILTLGLGLAGLVVAARRRGRRA